MDYIYEQKYKNRKANYSQYTCRDNNVPMFLYYAMWFSEFLVRATRE